MPNDLQAIPFTPKTPKDALALEISRAFADEIRLPFYREVCSAHPYPLVYRAYRDVMAIPAHQVRKSRRALFLFILHSYAND